MDPYQEKNYAAQANAKQASLGGCTSAERPRGPVTQRLDADIYNLSSQISRSHRAAQILRRNPEFEELIELFGLIRVPMRVQPICSVTAAVIE